MGIKEKEYLAKINYDTFQKEYPNFEFNNSEAFDYWIEKLKQGEELMLDENRFYFLLKHTDFKLVYLSQNFEKIFGNEVNAKCKNRLTFNFRRLHWKHLGSMLNYVRWGRSFSNEYSDKVHWANHFRYYCGIKLRHVNGTHRTIFVKLKFILFKEDGFPVLSLCEANDITHLFKSDLYWARLTAENEQYRFTCFHVSKGTKKKYDDILSSRELEILKLCAQQMSNKEIGSLLGISFQTVLKHRKNMIGRTGVKDMAGLLHICNLCDLI